MYRFVLLFAVPFIVYKYLQSVLHPGKMLVSQLGSHNQGTAT